MLLLPNNLPQYISTFISRKMLGQFCSEIAAGPGDKDNDPLCL